MVTFQTPAEDLHCFVSSDSDSLPLMHFILRETSGKSISSKLLDVLYTLPDLESLSIIKNTDGLMAGQHYPDQAHKVLCAAVKHDKYMEIVNIMLNAGTEINRCTHGGMSPLMLAALHGSVKIVELLVNRNASVRWCNARKENCLHIACKHKQWTVAKILFNHRANALCCDNKNNTPFSIARDSHCVSMVEHMASHDEAILQELLQTVSFTDACMFGYTMVVEYNLHTLTEQQISDGVSTAWRNRKVDILKLLSARLDEESLVKHIKDAYDKEHFDCVDVLLTTCQKDWTSLPCPEISLSQTCRSNELTNLTYLLIEKGQDVTENNGEPLRIAAKNGNLEAVRRITQHASLDEADATGMTALHYACKDNHVAGRGFATELGCRYKCERR